MQHRNRPHRITGSHSDRDPSVDHPDTDDDTALLKVRKDQRKHFEKDDTHNKRNIEVDHRESEHDNKDFNSHLLQDKRKQTRKVEGFRISTKFHFNDDKDALEG